MSMNELVDMQKDLMNKVPHDLKPQAFVRMVASVKVIDALLRYLNSTGHKPWRPNPLESRVQDKLMEELKEKVGFLSFLHYEGTGTHQDFPDLKHYQRQLVSAFGVIEETVEYLDTIAPEEQDPEKKSPKNRLEELVDALFFWMEQLILSGFDWDQVEVEYRRKWDENMERYRRAQEGDYGWDKRSEEKL